MTVPVLTVFNLKGGSGKTSLVYHLAWMMSELGTSVLVCDIDPQATLTATFLDGDHLTALWKNERDATTIYKCLETLTKGGVLKSPELQKISPTLHLLPGDFALAGFEDLLSTEWPNALSASPYRPFCVLTSLWRVAQLGAARVGADLIIFDIAPRLDAINRSALIASDYVIVPLRADPFSLQSLPYLGSGLHLWRMEWLKRRESWAEPQFPLPKGEMTPIGYVLQKLNTSLSRHLGDHDHWMDHIPNKYRESVLNIQPIAGLSLEADVHCLALLKHYRSLFTLSWEARKPIFHLTAADGAIGAHASAVREARDDFRKLATKISEKIGLHAA
jgi:chromosome partitioning protein